MCQPILMDVALGADVALRGLNVESKVFRLYSFKNYPGDRSLTEINRQSLPGRLERIWRNDRCPPPPKHVTPGNVGSPSHCVLGLTFARTQGSTQATWPLRSVGTIIMISHLRSFRVRIFKTWTIFRVKVKSALREPSAPIQLFERYLFMLF